MSSWLAVAFSDWFRSQYDVDTVLRETIHVWRNTRWCLRTNQTHRNSFCVLWRNTICPFVLEYATLAINLSLLQHSHLKFDTLDPLYLPDRATTTSLNPPDCATTISLSPQDRATTISHLITQKSGPRAVSCTWLHYMVSPELTWFVRIYSYGVAALKRVIIYCCRRCELDWFFAKMETCVAVSEDHVCKNISWKGQNYEIKLLSN